MCGQPVLHSSVEQNDQADEAKDRREKTKAILNAIQNIVRNARLAAVDSGRAGWLGNSGDIIYPEWLSYARWGALSSNPHFQRSTG